jgi:hypothetical protein
MKTIGSYGSNVAISSFSISASNLHATSNTAGGTRDLCSCPAFCVHSMGLCIFHRS